MIYYDKELLKHYRIITKEIFDSLPTSASLAEALALFIQKYYEKADFYIEELQKLTKDKKVKLSGEINLFYILMTLRVRYKNFFPAPSLCTFFASTLTNEAEKHKISNTYLSDVELLPCLLLLENKIEKVHFKDKEDSLLQAVKPILENSKSIEWVFETAEILEEKSIFLAQYTQNMNKDFFEANESFNTRLIYTSWNFLNNKEYQSIREDLLTKNNINSVYQLAQPTREGHKEYPALLLLNNEKNKSIKLIDLHNHAKASQYELERIMKDENSNVYLQISTDEALKQQGQKLAPSYYLAQNKNIEQKKHGILSDYAEVLRCQDVRVNITDRCNSFEDISKFGKHIFREATLKDIDNLTGFYLSDDADFVKVDNFSVKFEQFILQESDILIAFKGSKATIGTVGFYKSSISEESEEILKLSPLNGYSDKSSYKLPILPGNSFIIIRAKKIDPLYLFNYLQQAEMQELIKSQASGTSVLSLNTKTIKNLPIIEASLQEIENVYMQFKNLETCIRKIVCQKRLIKMRKAIPIYEVQNTFEMTQGERILNLEIINEAEDRGDYETEEKYRKNIPIEPNIAYMIKKYDGLDELKRFIDAGYDFSLVIEKYGEDWLYNDEL